MHAHSIKNIPQLFEWHSVIPKQQKKALHVSYTDQTKGNKSEKRQNAKFCKEKWKVEIRGQQHSIIKENQVLLICVQGKLHHVTEYLYYKK